MNKTYFKIIALVLIELILVLPISFALSISNITISDVTDSGADISWDTDTLGTSKINYGEDASLGETESSSDLRTSHKIDIDDLKGSFSKDIIIRPYELIANAGGDRRVIVGDEKVDVITEL